MIAGCVATLSRVIAGANVRWVDVPRSAGAKVYFANHSSHLDTLVLWAALPRELRERTRPVAARDYWGATGARRWLAESVFRAVLIERKEIRRTSNPLVQMLAVLERGESLIVFPEGTRGDGQRIGPFKGGLYHLARHRPEADLVPVHIDNLNRILPKGEFLPLPLLSCISFGPALHLEHDEPREVFLRRAEDAVRGLKQT